MARNPIVPCRECKAPMIFLTTKLGRSNPTNASTITNEEMLILEKGGDVQFNSDHHISHFSDCPARDRFRRKRGA